MSEEQEKDKSNEEQNPPQQEQVVPQEEKNVSNPEDKPNEESQSKKNEESPQPNVESSQTNQENKEDAKPEEKEGPKENQDKKEEQKSEEKKSEEKKSEEKKEEEKKEEEKKEEEEDEKDDENDEEKRKREEERKAEEEKLLKKFRKNDDKSIQEQIEQETIQIEQKKIDLRIMKERLNQKQKLYNQLQGKPVELTAEEKEKERREKKKANKNHKFTDPINRKKGREKQISDEREKIQKEDIKKKAQFQKLTTDINELLISNKDLRDEIVNLRKRKGEIQKKKKEMEEELDQKRMELENLTKLNEITKSKIKNQEYKDTVTEGQDINKDFEEERDELEIEYQKIREEYIKREREAKKENAKKRNMAAIALSNKSNLKSSRDKDIELEIKKLADEEVMDRTPMLDICIEKWREINHIKKTSIQIFQQNSTKIREALKKLTKCVGLDSFEQLPLVFKKTEQQMSNINMYKEKLEVQNDKLQYEKEMINNQIDLLSGTKLQGIKETSKLIKEKKENIEIINNCSKNFHKEIDIRMKLIEILYPDTKTFLSKLENTFLSDFIANKMNIDDTSEFSERTIEKYISNVEDYSRLIEEWDKASNENKEGLELDKLREEMKQKLGKFEQSRLISQDFYESMQLDYKKGIKLDEIIKKSSHKIALDIQNPYNKSVVLNKNIKNKKKMNISIATTEAGNYKSGNNSSMVNKQQQSSILYPNISMTTKNNNSKISYDKIAETA